MSSTQHPSRYRRAAPVGRGTHNNNIIYRSVFPRQLHTNEPVRSGSLRDDDAHSGRRDGRRGKKKSSLVFFGGRRGRCQVCESAPPPSAFLYRSRWRRPSCRHCACVRARARRRRRRLFEIHSISSTATAARRAWPPPRRRFTPTHNAVALPPSRRYPSSINTTRPGPVVSNSTTSVRAVCCTVPRPHSAAIVIENKIKRKTIFFYRSRLNFVIRRTTSTVRSCAVFDEYKVVYTEFFSRL